MKYNPFLDPRFVSAIIDRDSDSQAHSEELWIKAHHLTTAVAQYCSEQQIHPTYVCAWFGASERSESYAEAAMLASMKLVKTINGEEQIS